ncbi:MAG: peptide-methionine (S)-S-oxide reductase MsrA [Gemmatimonadaceae bacterium]|nr:peptide-methionine (S)-S-oxide reductase MsrA [Gemmatimonadaceae bacterium]
MRALMIPLAIAISAVACGAQGSRDTADGDVVRSASATNSAMTPGTALDTAIFAGGCFWCMEPPFDKLAGVISTTSGYTSGRTPNPTYEQVSSGGTGHTEGIQVVFDPAKVSYNRLLTVFWRNIDPFARNRQFCDRGDQYRSGIYPRNAAQQAAADASLRAVDARFDEPIATEIVPASRFYAAEEYHQDYYTKNPVRYKYYRFSCGRDARLKSIWGDEAGG